MLEENVKDGEVIVPSGRLFVLGENRDISLDSRYWGFVPVTEVIAKPLIVYGSVDDLGNSRPERVFLRLK